MPSTRPEDDLDEANWSTHPKAAGQAVLADLAIIARGMHEDGSLPGRREALAVHYLILARLAAAGIPESAVKCDTLTNEVPVAA